MRCFRIEMRILRSTNHEFNNQAETLVLDCLRSTYVSSVGEYVSKILRPNWQRHVG